MCMYTTARLVNYTSTVYSISLNFQGTKVPGENLYNYGFNLEFEDPSPIVLNTE